MVTESQNDAPGSLNGGTYLVIYPATTLCLPCAGIARRPAQPRLARLAAQAQHGAAPPPLACRAVHSAVARMVSRRSHCCCPCSMHVRAHAPASARRLHEHFACL
eukprot:5859605-Pleurochrysis_carterae.AAC.2